MNLNELDYLIKLEEEKNITKAAKKLYITPSALNQHLHKLEEEIGTVLFVRTNEGWIPTEAGEVYLETAKRILVMKSNAYNMIYDIASLENNSLTIGLPPERGTNMFTSVYPIFHKEFPNVTINLIEKSVLMQQDLISKGSIDLGFVTLMNSQKTNDNYVHIKDEELFIVLHSENPICKLATKKRGYPYQVLSLNDIKKEAFAIMHKDSTFRHCVDELFLAENLEPNILFETARTRTIMNMVAANICCGVVPYAAVSHAKENVRFFCMENRPKWGIYATYKKGNYLRAPSKRLIELATDYWNNKK
ncbi:MAG: LysR family transcriptional regulator [Lachnospirales bacterium]